ncbi:hypothetical protein BKA66DRAFT_479588 [Pyrenochaeta sp. MPI-SDFR-AT-0127]|nr:hypothetical protein BKA66DRAFT_479588 [Pyrenochaeta sp. MPI-SDFR-AT-0127]
MSRFGTISTIVFNLIMLATKTLLFERGTHNPPVITAKINPIFSHFGSWTFRSINMGRSRITLSIIIFITPENIFIFVYLMHNPRIVFLGFCRKDCRKRTKINSLLNMINRP